MATAHNNAKMGDIAKNVLMPGDPLRAKFIAENFLEDIRLVNTVRNVFAYTGTYKGKEITIMASGMGMPSIGIYSYELYNEYGVENIVRVGSAGSYVADLKLYDVVLADSAWSQSTYAKVQNGCEDDVMLPGETLNNMILEAGKRLDLPVTLGRIHSSDVFYRDPKMDDYKTLNEKHGVLCVEMESFALFHNAKVLGKNAACLLTISDSFITEEKATAEERQTAFKNMMKIALEAFC